MIHYLAQSNRGPKIVFAMPFYRNITSKCYILLHGLSQRIVSLPWRKYCSTCILSPHKFPRSLNCYCRLQKFKNCGIEFNRFKRWNGNIHRKYRDLIASFHLFKMSSSISIDKIFFSLTIPSSLLNQTLCPPNLRFQSKRWKLETLRS